MRRTLVFILSVLLVGLMVAPVAASPDFLLKLNGEYYQTPLEVQDGVSSVGLEFIEKAVPVQTTVEDGKIILTVDDAVLELTVGSEQAIFNGQGQNMPVAPKVDNQEIMLPLRFVLETLGAGVDWDGSKNEISVTSALLKNGLTAEQMLGKITAAMSAQGRYKMKADTVMAMEMTSEGKTEKMTVSGQVTGAVQEQPLLAYVTSEMKLEEMSGIEGRDPEFPEEDVQSEIVVNENGIFMTLPGYEGWVKMEVEGLDLDKLMEQYGSQDPVKQIVQMKEFGAIIYYLDDQVQDGKNYGVIHVAMGAEALGQYMDSIIEQTGVLGLIDEATDGTNLADAMEELFKTMQTDIDYNMVFDYETFLTTSMEMNMNMDMKIDIPANEETGTCASSGQVKTTQKALYHIYDYGVEFTAPDVSGAVSMAEAMESLMESAPN